MASTSDRQEHVSTSLHTAGKDTFARTIIQAMSVINRRMNDTENDASKLSQTRKRMYRK